MFFFIIGMILLFSSFLITMILIAKTTVLASIFDGFLILLSGILIGVGGSESADGTNPAMVIFGFILLAISVVHIIYRFRTITTGIVEEQKNSEEIVRGSEAREFYRACLKRNIVPSGPEDKKDDLNLIASNLGIETNKDLYDYYTYGKVIVESEEIEEKNKAFQELRDKDFETVSSEKETASIVGKEKYLKKILCEKANHEALLFLTEDSINHKINSRNFKATKHDSAIRGGLVSGLAGPAAGIATAIKTEAENARAEAYAKEVRESANEGLDECIEHKRNHEHIISDCDYFISKFDEKLVDDRSPEKLMKSLQFYDWSFELKDSNNVIASAKLKPFTSSKILDKESILDGSLKLNIKDRSGSVIGYGYYNAPGLNCVDLDEAGFNNVSGISALCIIDKYNGVDTNFLTCSVEPVNLWLIEK